MPKTLSPLRNTDTSVTLRRLVVLRWWLLAGEVAAILVVPVLLDIALPRWPMLVVVGLQILANTLVARRINRTPAFDDGELFVQLVLDIVALTVLMFLSGGAANPLISLLLPPVAIAALGLSAGRVAIIAGLAVAAYSLLNLIYLPLPIADVERAARLHLAGMWFTFVVSVVMLAWFVVRMTASIRQRDAELAAVREKALRDERVIALGSLAAGAAHELSTPLATMAIVAGELAHDASLGEAAHADVALLRKQIAACKGIISGLTERAGAERLDNAAAVQADRWLSEVHRRWLELRPSATSDLKLAGRAPAPMIITDKTLEQGLLNLFSNAADTGSEVSVVADWDGEWLTIEVHDSGPGFAAPILEQAGREPFPTHAAGSGIGLFLAHAAISRLGGQLSLHNDGGGVARIRLPATVTT
ncbi:ATP-binding protein [Propionivibrio sp.]|uniref:ATP-binding protein n=1 Tax=Propionivibrio sp. TaxID=2212460 RepID=UPI003BF2EAC5